MKDDCRECALCGKETSRVTITHTWHIFQFECEACGRFVVELQDYEDFLENKSKREEHNATELSTLTRERCTHSPNLHPLYLQFEAGRSYPEVNNAYPVYVKQLLGSRCPHDIPERIDRALCNLARLSKFGGTVIRDVAARNIPLFFARNADEAIFVFNALKRGEFIADAGTQGCFRVTAKGWGRYSELTSAAGSAVNPVFVAMWFGGKDQNAKMKDLFDNGIERAILAAGFKATRVDLEQHNDFIMDKVLGDIQQAPFVVADFTENRNGVYFEAGFARGLPNKPVIHCCCTDDRKKSHFDVQQINCIEWTDPQDLKTKLYHRIRGTIGMGPFDPTPLD